ncbi:MAG: peptidoglycan-binding domain-containing protein [Candidatus Omnitrophica bacterium]|nr:peptidoglycan-binding domain-containing protein [Candidatus Omnitrophota bacterium]
MKKFLAVAVIVAVGITVFGCGKKQEAQEPMTMEALNTINAPAAVTPEARATAEAPVQAAPVAAQAPAQQMESLPAVPSVPAKPSPMDIQTALKNAGYYSGSIDGKIGLKSKKAIEDFQKANGLTADGKVGPKTWAALSKYLTAQVTSGQAQ